MRGVCLTNLDQWQRGGRRSGTHGGQNKMNQQLDETLAARMTRHSLVIDLLGLHLLLQGDDQLK